MHRIVRWQFLLFSAREHRQDAHCDRFSCHRRSPVSSQEIQADITVGINVYMLWCRLQKVNNWWFTRVFFRENHAQLELFTLVDSSVGSLDDHDPLSDIGAN